jgi:hypothetical protein
MANLIIGAAYINEALVFGEAPHGGKIPNQTFAQSKLRQLLCSLNSTHQNDSNARRSFKHRVSKVLAGLSVMQLSLTPTPLN